MRNTLLIARREYMERIRARSFVVMTVLIPLLMGGGIFTTVYFGGTSQRARHITIVSPDTDLAIKVQDELAAMEPDMNVDAISPPTPDTMHILSGDVEDMDMKGFLWVDAAASRQAIFYGKPGKHLLLELGDALTQAAPRANLRLPVGISVENIGTSQRESTNLSPSQSARAVAYILFFLMYFSVMMYGVNVARSITEEKTSRVFEVMLATVTPEEMMAGKVIGVGGVGLTQVAIWMAAAAVLITTPLMPMISGGSLSISLSFAQMLFFILMYVLGFMLYASMAAILGAIVSSEQELGQLNMILAMPMFFCFAVSYTVAQHSNGLLAVVTSLLPPCTALLMVMRVAVGHVPLWQIALSVVDLVLAIYAMMWIASRIYRVGILMYGKRPSLREILRWMRYS
jgi:ABC-2 type transport system permease protein